MQELSKSYPIVCRESVSPVWRFSDVILLPYVVTICIFCSCVKTSKHCVFNIVHKKRFFYISQAFILLFHPSQKYIIGFRFNPAWLEAKPKLLSTQDTTDASSFCLVTSLWLFALSFAVESPWSSPHILPPVTITPSHSAFPLTIHLWTHKGWGWKLSLLWELPPDSNTQRLDFRSAECDKAPETVVYTAVSSHPAGDLFP